MLLLVAVLLVAILTKCHSGPYRVHSRADSTAAGGDESPATRPPCRGLRADLWSYGTYMLLPVGFGAIFLNDILLANLNSAGEPLGLEISRGMVPMAMALPGGMAMGLLVALLFSYRGQRSYAVRRGRAQWPDAHACRTALLGLVVSGVAIVAALGLRLHWLMIVGGLVGIGLLSLGGIFR